MLVLLFPFVIIVATTWNDIGAALFHPSHERGKALILLSLLVAMGIVLGVRAVRSFLLRPVLEFGPKQLLVRSALGPFTFNPRLFANGEVRGLRFEEWQLGRSQHAGIRFETPGTKVELRSDLSAEHAAEMLERANNVYPFAKQSI